MPQALTFRALGACLNLRIQRDTIGKILLVATVRLGNGRIRRVELHWYEAHGLGKRKMKIKRYLD
jgi:hypothetical protein